MSFSGLSRVGVRLLAVVMVAAGLAVVIAGSGVAAAASRTSPHGGRMSVSAAAGHGFSPTARQLEASSLRTTHAVRALAPTAPGAKVPWLSRANSDTFVAGSGHLMAKIYPYSVNYRDPAGSWTAINPALEASGSGYTQTANDLGVRLPKTAAAVARVADPAGGLSFRLTGAAGTGKVTGTTEMFSHALPGVKLAYGSQSSGVAWQAQLTAVAAGRGLSWTVRATTGLSPKLVSGGVAFRTAAGKVAWVFTAPTARQAGTGTPVATRISLTHTSGGTVIHVSAAAARATRSSAVFSPLAAPAIVATAVPTSDQIVWSGEVVAGR
jgi:hypothetical protein